MRYAFYCHVKADVGNVLAVWSSSIKFLVFQHFFIVNVGWYLFRVYLDAVHNVCFKIWIPTHYRMGCADRQRVHMCAQAVEISVWSEEHYSAAP